MLFILLVHSTKNLLWMSINSKSFLGPAVEIGTLIVNFAVGTAAVGLSGTVDLKSWVNMEGKKSSYRHSLSCV